MLFRLKRVFYITGNLIQFLPSGFVSIMRAKPHTETITRITGKDVQVDVIILVDHTDFQLARQYLTKYAVIRFAHKFQPPAPLELNLTQDDRTFATEFRENTERMRIHPFLSVRS